MRSLALLVPVVLLVSCGSSPADVAGSYTVGITNRDNGCNFQNWTVGQQTTGIGVDITQDASNKSSATAVVNGLTGTYLDGVIGSHTFTGDVSGDELNLEIFGTRSYTMSNCAYTINVSLLGALTGDALAGTLDYTTSTNGSPDCGAIQGCKSQQAFTGSRPPSP